MLSILVNIQKATLAARSRTNDSRIGTRVEAGKFQVVRTSYAKNGTSKIEPISDFVSADEVVKILNSIQ